MAAARVFVDDPRCRCGAVGAVVCIGPASRDGFVEARAPVPEPKPCLDCFGSGGGRLRPCPVCRGTGARFYP